MQDMLNQLTGQIGEYVPSLIAAIAILLIGWLVALTIAAVVRGGINRLTKDRDIAKTADGKPIPIGTWIGRAVFYVLMVFVLAGAFQTLRIQAVSGPLDSMLQQFAGYVPQLIGAAILLLVAWAIGYVLRLVVSQALSRTKLDEKIAEGAGLETQKPLSKTLGEVAFWLPMLLLLPAVIGTLGLEGLVAPLQGMFDDLLRVLPDLVGAALILLIGWFIARIVRQVTAALLVAAGADRLGEKVGMGPEAGERRLSNVVGLLVYALILIPATVAALDALRIEAISRPATSMLNQILAAVPLLFGAALVLGIAFMVGRVVAGLVTGVLAGVGFDDLFGKLGLRVEGDRTRNSPSQIAGYLTIVAIMLVAAIEAASMLGFVAVSDLATEFFGFGTRLLLGLVIFGAGLYLGNLAHRAIPRGAGRWGGLYASAARIAIVVLATAMALQQTGVAQEIVTLAFGAVLGAIALAGAIAFGLGAREAAGRTIDQWLAGQEDAVDK
jgi:hypothetical protein